MICLKNIVVIIIMVVVLLAAVEITRMRSNSKYDNLVKDYEKKLKTSRKLNSSCEMQVHHLANRPPRVIERQVPLPINQLTHEYIDNWHYVGYVFPIDKKSANIRYPLYARKNLYQRHLYDYHIVDNSRNRVKIYIDVPKGQYELQDGDKVEIDSEPGLWYVRIDSPADGNPYLYVP